MEAVSAIVGVGDVHLLLDHGAAPFPFSFAL